jgi:hypothetical protein
VFSDILQSAIIYGKPVPIWDYVSHILATHVALHCFRTKKCELFSMFYMTPNDLELTGGRKKDVEFVVCTKSSGSCSL